MAWGKNNFYDGHEAFIAELKSDEADGNFALIRLVAKYTLFTNPATIQALSTVDHVFPTIRGGSKRDKPIEHESSSSLGMYDDNTTPHITFVCLNGLKSKKTFYRELVFNHIYGGNEHRKDPENSIEKRIKLYTNPRNIVATPSFISKLTDKIASEYLQFRAYELYSFDPLNRYQNQFEAKPPRYDELKWADCLPGITNPEKQFREAIQGRNNRWTRCIMNYGWCFSGFKPENLT